MPLLFSLLICIVPCRLDIIPDVLGSIVQVIRNSKLSDKCIIKSAFIEINMAIKIVCKGQRVNIGVCECILADHYILL